MFKVLFIMSCAIYMVLSAPQGVPPAPAPPMPYNYNYTVSDPEVKLFHDKTESGDETGKVSGKYSVLLPDGRLMTVEYTVEGESGFVPKISFQDNANPFR